MSAERRTIGRRAFVVELSRACPSALVMAGLGASAYDLFASGDRDESFYLWGAMGGAAAMGLAFAFARPDRSVLVLTETASSGMERNKARSSRAQATGEEGHLIPSPGRG